MQRDSITSEIIFVFMILFLFTHISLSLSMLFQHFLKSFSILFCGGGDSFARGFSSHPLSIPLYPPINSSWSLFKSTFYNKKRNQNYVTKKFLLHHCLIIYPPFSLKRPMDVFISILIRLNFHRRNQKGVKLELLLSLIALLGDKLWKLK